MSAPPGLPLRAPATLFAGAGSSPQPAWWRGFEGQAPAHRKMRDSSVFSFFGEPCSLIFRPREHVPRWRRWCGHCLWRPCWGRVFLDQRGELRSRARPCASIGGGHRFPDANGGGLDAVRGARIAGYPPDIAVRKATRLRSEEHTSEPQSLMRISYAVLCLKQKNLPEHTQSLKTNTA